MSSKLKISDSLDLPIEAVTQTFAVLAKRGVGKTYTACVMVEEMLGANQQVVVADPIGVWWGLRSSADGKGPGFPITVFGGEHADVPLEEDSGEVIAGAIVEHGFSAILDLSLLRKAAQVRFMTSFAEALYRLNRKPLHFVVDEADAFAPQRPLPGEQRLLGAFEDIVRRGRARGLGVTLITQRAAVLNKNVLTQIEVLVCLRTIAPQDRDAIEAWIEVHGTQKQRDAMMADLPSLEIGMAFFWSPGWLDIFKKVQVRKKITFDSSATPKVGQKVIAPKQIAPVDLEQLGEQIKSTVARQKENDPAELKRQIAQLKKDLRTAGSITKIEKGSISFKEVPVLSKPERARLDKLLTLLGHIQRDHDRLRGVTECAVEQIKFFKERLGVLVANGDKAALARAKPALFQQVKQILNKPSDGAHGVTRPTSNGDISGGLKRMMIALAQRPGLTKKQIGVRAGLSSSSGTFGTYLGKLRSNAWVIEESGGLALSENGRLELGDFTPLPEGQDLLNYWLKELGGGAQRMLQVLAEAYPQALTKEELGNRAQISHSSGTFGTYLGKLRTLELIEGKGELRAAREFFE